MIYYKLLEKLKIDVNNFKDEFLSHPDYPSMLAVTDSLTKVGIENLAASVPFQHIDQLPDIFIAEINEDKRATVIIERKDNSYIVSNANNKETISKNHLERIWNNNVLLLDDNTNVVVRKEKRWFRNVEIIIFLILISSLLINPSNAIIIFSTTLGLFISFELLKINIYKDAQWSALFCNISNNFSCDEVSKHSKILTFKNVHFYDFPIIYFIVSGFILVFNHSLQTFAVVSILTFPFILYSFYKQYKIIKKWCLLCLIVAILLIINALWFVFSREMNLDYVNIFTTVLIILIVSTVWFRVKKILLKNKELKDQIYRLERFKRNENIFYKINQPIQNISFNNELKLIEMGDSNCNELTLFITPSCPFCHKAILQALELVEKFKDRLTLKIGYNLMVNNEDNPYLKVAAIIQQLHHNKQNVITELKEWHQQEYTLERFLKKWSDLRVNKDVLEIINKQNYFCVNNHWHYAPVMIFNNHLVDNNYEIKELYYFLNK